MRASYSLGSLLTIDEVLRCAGMLSGKADTVWIPETWGMEIFSMLGAVSQANPDSKIGSSIINIYSRSPSVIAMGALTADTLSRGRLVLGLGTGSVPIVEEFHGYKFERPLSRMREYVEIIRTITSTGKASYSGDIFKLKNFTLLTRPYRSSIPIYLAAVNRGMVDLAWEISDGVIFFLRPLDELRETVRHMQSRCRITVSCQLVTCVSEDADPAILRAKKTIAFYVAVGGIYRDFLAKNGFAAETGAVLDEFRRSGMGSIHELVPDRMVESLAVAGTPEHCRRQLGAFRNAGVDMPILQFNPVGEMAESFRLLTDTFSEAA